MPKLAASVGKPFFKSFWMQTTTHRKVSLRAKFSMPQCCQWCPRLLPTKAYCYQWTWFETRSETCSAERQSKLRSDILCSVDRASLYNLFQRCTLLLSIFISTSLHVSGNYVPIIRRTYCISMRHWYFSLLYGWLSGMLQHTRQPSIQHFAPNWFDLKQLTFGK